MTVYFWVYRLLWPVVKKIQCSVCTEGSNWNDYTSLQKELTTFNLSLQRRFTSELGLYSWLETINVATKSFITQAEIIKQCFCRVRTNVTTLLYVLCFIRSTTLPTILKCDGDVSDWWSCCCDENVYCTLKKVMLVSRFCSNNQIDRVLNFCSFFCVFFKKYFWLLNQLFYGRSVRSELTTS